MNQIQVAELNGTFLQHKQFRFFAVPLQAGLAVIILRTTGCEACNRNGYQEYFLGVKAAGA